jgi:hypothetical protein
MCSRHHHHVTILRDSALFRPFFNVVVSCETNHYMASMSPADIDLAWAACKCFACGRSGHKAEKCAQVPRPHTLLCQLLEFPNGE